jgi:hypothetical protein
MRRYILAALAAAGIGLGGTFGASAVPISGSILGATAPAPELQKAYYYRRACRRGIVVGHTSASHKIAVKRQPALGQKLTCAAQTGMSALHPKADVCGALADVRFQSFRNLR